jgi:hypothetical protein
LLKLILNRFLIYAHRFWRWAYRYLFFS